MKSFKIRLFVSKGNAWLTSQVIIIQCEIIVSWTL